MMQRNLLSALLLFTAVTLLQVSFVSGLNYQNMYITGEWQLKSASFNSIVEPIPAGRTITLKLEEESEFYRVNIKVANILMSSIQIVETNNDGVETIQAGPMASTRMMPPPDLQAMERFFTTHFEQLNLMKIENDFLIMEGGNAELKWERPNDAGPEDAE